MADHSNAPLSEAAQAVADSKIPPGDEYEEIREQVRAKSHLIVFPWMNLILNHLIRLVLPTTGSLPADCQYCSNNEEHFTGKCENRKGFQGNSPRMCFRIHLVHYL
jgi:hypothetical protein